MRKIEYFHQILHENSIIINENNKIDPIQKNKREEKIKTNDLLRNNDYS